MSSVFVCFVLVGGCLQYSLVLWEKPLITQMLASQALWSCSWLEHALAYRSRNASLSSLTLRPAVAAALALLFDVEEFLGSSKAAAKGEGALATKP